MPPLSQKDLRLLVVLYVCATLACWGFWKTSEALEFEYYNPLLYAFCSAPWPLLYLFYVRDGFGHCRASCFALGLMTLVHFGMGMVLSPLELTNDNRKRAQTRRGLEASSAPGWTSINCTANPEGIDVRTDRFTYFTLAAQDWRVASENVSVVESKSGRGYTRRWGVSPIEYVGPVDGCRTRYPLFAVCIASQFNAECGWDGRRTVSHSGTLSFMRLLSASDKLDSDRKPFWDEWVPNPYDPSQKVKLHHENLFEFDSVSYAEAVRKVAEVKEAYDKMMTKFVIAWFAVTVPLTLCACLCLHYTHCDAGCRTHTSVAKPEEEHPSPPTTPEEPHPLLAPLSEHTGGPSEQGCVDGRAAAGYGDHPLRSMGENEADVVNAVCNDPLSNAVVD